MAKFLGFLLGVAVALAGPAVFGVLAAPGGIELNAKELALAFGIGALVFWAVVSYFSGAGALGAFVAFATLVYCWLWIPNRTTNFLNDVPGVTTGMIDGSKQYTLNGVVPILGVISLVYSIQLIVRSVQRRRRDRVEADRLQREQEAAQAQQEADVAAVYPVAGSTYAEPAPAYESHTRYDDLFDEPEPVQPRNQADEQTRQFPVGDDGYENTQPFPQADADSNEPTQVAELHQPEAPAPEPEPEAQEEEPAAEEPPAAETKPAEETQAMPVEATQAMPVEETHPAEQAPSLEQTQPMPVEPAEETQPTETKAPEAAAPEATAPEATAPDAAPTAAEAKPVEPQAPEAKAEQPGPAESPAAENKPAASPAAESKPVESNPVESKPVQSNPVQSNPVGSNPVQMKVGPKEQVGSQYRERMEDPEDTGEFHLAFVENPAVKPA